MAKIVDMHKRLNQACNDNPRIPRLHEGLYPYIGERIGASNEAVRKWFSGESRPRNDKIETLAKIVGCDPVWLATGTAPEYTKVELKDWSDRATGAAYLVYGMLTMAGGKWLLPVPLNPKGLTIIGVIPENPFAPVVLEMPAEDIESLRSKRSGGYDIAVERSRTEFKTGDHRWSRFMSL